MAMDFGTQERYQQLVQEQAQQTPLTAQDVRDAREAYHTAMERAGAAQGTINYPELAQTELDAKATYDDVMRRGGHLEGIEREQQRQAQLDKDREQAQLELSAQKEAIAKADARTKYLAAGGLPDAFDSAWPGMWSNLLRHSTMNAMQIDHDDQVTKLRKSGLYNL